MRSFVFIRKYARPLITSDRFASSSDNVRRQLTLTLFPVPALCVKHFTRSFVGLPWVFISGTPDDVQIRGGEDIQQRPSKTAKKASRTGEYFEVNSSFQIISNILKAETPTADT